MTDTLPPLPTAGISFEDERGRTASIRAVSFGAHESVAVYSADQMRAFRLEGVLAEREACAKLCEDLADPKNSGSLDPWDRGYEVGKERCAAAIRARNEKGE